MLSSSVWNDPELPPAPSSFNRPEPGWATEDDKLCLPLLFWSSSPLLAPLIEGRLRRCPKLLLNRLETDGLGELARELSAAAAGGAARKEAGIPAVREERFLT